MDLQEQILALEPALLAFAGRLTDDAQEAQALVRLTMEEAMAEPGDEPPTQVRLFPIMRRAFHSIARRSTARRARGSPGNGVWNPAPAPPPSPVLKNPSARGAMGFAGSDKTLNRGRQLKEPPAMSFDPRSLRRALKCAAPAIPRSTRQAAAPLAVARSGSSDPRSTGR